ncbi:MAG: gluconeogenesis factor YvcK family protein [Mycobacterium sp.]
MGGGHGLAATLAAARQYTDDVTAIVSVADDGGSSGRLRQSFGVHPPGDLRKCLVAMGDPKSLWTAAFDYRFDAGELEGHALGNLVIAGLAEALGDFIEAIGEAARLVGAVGRVFPATSAPVVLKGEYAGGEIEGQVAVAATPRIARVSVVPAYPEAPEGALQAIARADQVILGPGSLYTSVLAVVAVPALRAALASSSAMKAYVCNLGQQVPETAGYDVAAHVEALCAHGVEVDTVVCDTTTMPLGSLARPFVDRPLAGANGGAHDPARLADALADLML